MDKFTEELKKLGIEAQVKNIFGIRICNIATISAHWISGPYPNRCSVYLEMQKTPEFKYYHFLEDKYLVSYDDFTGAVHTYEYCKGTTDGFAGSVITLSICDPATGDATDRTFKGSLWDTGAASRAAAKFFDIETVKVAFTEWRKRGGGCSIDIDKRVLDMKLKMAGIAFIGPSSGDDR